MRSGVPCGCRERERARDYDPGSENARDHDAVGREWQRQWRCPRAGLTPPSHPDGLSPECHETIRALEHLTGREGAGLCTCPESYMALPWAVRAARAWFWRDKSQLALIEPTPISSPLAHALAVLDEQRAVRSRNDAEKFRRDTAPKAP